MVELNVAWAYALLERMGFVKRKATTAKSMYEVEKFKELKHAFLNDVKITVEMEDIPAELILNWDQTGIRIVPSCNWTMEVQGAKRVEIIGVGDEWQITAIFCGSLTGDFLPLQVIYSGKTSQMSPLISVSSRLEHHTLT